MTDSTFVHHLYPYIVNTMQLGLHIYRLENVEDDRTLKLITTNPVADKIIGLTTGDVLGKTIDESFPLLRSQSIPSLFADVVRSGKAAEFEKEVSFDKNQGSKAWFLFRTFPLPDKCVAVLFEEITRRKQSELERDHLLAAEREQRLLAETLREVTLTLTSQTDHEAVLDEILRQVQRVVPYRTANISLLKENALHFVRLKGYESRKLEKFLIKQVQPLKDFTLEAEVIESRQPVVVDDTHQEKRWIVLDKTAWIRSHVVVPICHQDDVLGLLRLDSDTPHQYTAEDASRLLPLANAAAIALENARLYEQARKDAETKSVLLNEVNHRVKNNLAAIIGLLYAKQEAHRKLKDKANYQTTMKELVNQMQGLATVHNMLSASRWAPLLLNELVSQVIHSAMRALACKQQALIRVSPSLVRVTSDQAHHLALVINELATNTIKHALSCRQELKIMVRITTHHQTVRLEFRDNGPGYPARILLSHDGYGSMGVKLIDSIVYKNLGGAVTFYNDDGAVALIEFRPA